MNKKILLVGIFSLLSLSPLWTMDKPEVLVKQEALDKPGATGGIKRLLSEREEPDAKRRRTDNLPMIDCDFGGRCGAAFFCYAEEYLPEISKFYKSPEQEIRSLKNVSFEFVNTIHKKAEDEFSQDEFQYNSAGISLYPHSIGQDTGKVRYTVLDKKAFFQKLLQCKRIEELHIDRGWTWAGAEIFQDLFHLGNLHTLTSLTHLSLTGCIFGSFGMINGMKIMGLVISDLKSLKYLNLSKNGITHEGFLGIEGYEETSSSLSTHSSLETLDIGNNFITVETMTWLLTKLPRNLKELIVECGGDEFYDTEEHEINKGEETYWGRDARDALIFDDGAQAISDALAQNIGLTKLDLGHHKFTIKGALILADGLKKNTTLKKLSLKENDIDKEGAIAFVKRLHEGGNTTLTVLNLRTHDKNVALSSQIQQYSHPQLKVKLYRKKLN